MTYNITHIVNPVAADSNSRFHFIQEVTYRSMLAAKDFAPPEIQLEFLSVQYPEDHKMLPPEFRITPDLERSILDVKKFKKHRKLPLISDILTSAYENSHSEFFIFTNIDIGLMPFFYHTVATYINRGFDAFTINRRTITSEFKTVSEIPMMYADLGEPHRGWDCFIFKREAVQGYQLGSVCVGAPLVGLALISNLIANSKKFLEIKDKHLTFHLGNDRSWNNSPYAEYADHNKRETLDLLKNIEAKNNKFSRQSPPGRFLFVNSNPVFKRIFDLMNRIYIPAKYTRKQK